MANRFASFTTRFDGGCVFEDIEPVDDDSDDEAACEHPHGHAFRTSCGVTRCLYCRQIAWK
jgi:hypothetical protein